MLLSNDHSPSLLLDSTMPLEVYISGSSSPFYLQQAMLASVSPELASSVIGNPILISDHAFRIFVVWLLYR